MEHEERMAGFAGRFPPGGGPEALFHGRKGDKGERGERGEPGAAMTPGARRAVAFLLVLTLALAAANLLWTSRQVTALRSAVVAACQFDSDLGTAPITINPATKKASKLGVSIVADSRVAWRGLGCPGQLAGPAPSFVKWAKFYKLPDR